MINAITIDRSTRNYAEVLDVLELMACELGSATNAAIQCIRDSRRFTDAEEKLARSKNTPKQHGGRNVKSHK